MGCGKATPVPPGEGPLAGALAPPDRLVMVSCKENRALEPRMGHLAHQEGAVPHSCPPKLPHHHGIQILGIGIWAAGAYPVSSHGGGTHFRPGGPRGLAGRTRRGEPRGQSAPHLPRGIRRPAPGGGGSPGHLDRCPPAGRGTGPRAFFRAPRDLARPAWPASWPRSSPPV